MGLPGRILLTGPFGLCSCTGSPTDRALEDQGVTWRHRDALFFTMLVSACVANLWLWMRQ